MSIPTAATRTPKACTVSCQPMPGFEGRFCPLTHTFDPLGFPWTADTGARSRGTALVRFLTAIVMAALMPGVVSGLWKGILGIASHRGIWLPLLVGTGISLVLDRLLRRRMGWFEVFEHELTHALAALLFLRRVQNFAAGESGGAVTHSGNFGGKVGDDFIGLAPYFLPTFTVVAVLLRPAFPGDWFPWYDGFIGLTLGFHLWTTLRETRSNWQPNWFPGTRGDATRSDIGRRGILFSSVYILAMTLCIHGVLSFVLVRGYGGIPVWGRAFGSAFARFWTGLGPWAGGLFGG